MENIRRTDVLDSLIPDRPMTAFQVARMLALRGCVEDDAHDAEDRVRRHLAALAREGRVRRGGRSEDGLVLWAIDAVAARSRRRRYTDAA